MTGQDSQREATLKTALAHAARLLESEPGRAAAQAREILKASPRHPQALLYLASAQRRQGEASAARELLEPLSQQQPKAPSVWLELGLTRAVQGETRPAIAALKRAAALAPNSGETWAALAEQLALIGDETAAADARAQQIRAATRNPALLEAASALCAGKLALAERALRDFLK